MLGFIMTCVIIFFAIVLYRFIKENEIRYEHMDTNITNQGAKLGSTEKKAYKGTFNSTFNGSLSISDLYFYDKLFDDVVYYPNKYLKDENMNEIVKTGDDSCVEECLGNCVSFGFSGNSYCFNPV